MAGHPDDQATGVWEGDPLVEEDSIAVGNATIQFGPFGISGFRCLIVWWIMSTGDSDAVVTFNPNLDLSLPDTQYAMSVGSGEQGLYVIPAAGAVLADFSLTSSTVGSTADIWVAGSNRDPMAPGDNMSGILLPFTNSAIGAGATVTHLLTPAHGRARLICNLVGGNYALLGTAETRIGTVEARWLDRAAITGEQDIEIWLPPRINRLRITNNTGGNQTPTRNVISLPAWRT